MCCFLGKLESGSEMLVSAADVEFIFQLQNQRTRHFCCSKEEGVFILTGTERR